MQYYLGLTQPPQPSVGLKSVADVARHYIEVKGTWVYGFSSKHQREKGLLESSRVVALNDNNIDDAVELSGTRTRVVHSGSRAVQ